MAVETVNYRAKSIFSSRTVIFNALTAAAALTMMPQFSSLLGVNAPEVLAILVPFINIGLRYFTTRPVAVIAPGSSVPVPVKKLE